MTENLIIVESPAKAKTIEKFLGKDFAVMSSFGHVRDLPKKNEAIDIENGFEPTYIISPGKRKVVNQLKQAVKKSRLVWLASDEDREGEAIAWHLSEALGLKEENTRRIVFHEITEPAILSAIKTPRSIDVNLVNGQQARRVLDRLVGFELSPVLWKKVKSGLSAGRVQSVAVRLVVEREREIDKFTAQSAFRISAGFETAGKESIKATFSRDIPDIDAGLNFLEKIKDRKFSVVNIEKKLGKRSPSPPFTTSTLQQAASSRLGFSVRNTMSVAQKLYESGFITYMRTDSFTLSEQSRKQIKSWVNNNLGKEFYQSRVYKTKSALAQEAHEAIRPTDINRRRIDGEESWQKLYDIIWRKAVASQMSDAKIARTTLEIGAQKEKEPFITKGEVITFPGFLEVFGYKQDESGILPPAEVGDKLALTGLQAQETFARPPARFTEASLVKKLEELGIGRPSTYAPTITTIQNRGYVEQGAGPGVERTVRILTMEKGKIKRADKTEMTGSNKGKLVPSDIAGIVTDLLVKHFPEVIDYNFTAKVEDQFDKIAVGKLDWRNMLKGFYFPFHSDVEKVENISRDELNRARILGVDPAGGGEVSVRLGQYGPYARMGEGDSVRFAGLKPEHKLDTVTLEDVLPLFELPRNLGLSSDGEAMTVNSGRFGPYAGFVNVKAEKLVADAGIKGVEIVAQNVSIDPEDPLYISPEKTEEFIKAKKHNDHNKEIKLFEGSKVQILNGRWGPFVTDGIKNAKIPENANAEELSLEECEAILTKVNKEKKRLTKSFHGGGYVLLKNPDGIADITLKIKKNCEKKALALADKLKENGIKARLISARGAAEIKKAGEK